MSLVQQVSNKDYVVSVHMDFHPEDPRGWSNLGKMACWHRRYNLGDKHNFDTPEEFQEEINEKDYLILPLYLYDHSGITMSTTPFSCRWDSGQVGYVYVSHKDIVKEYGELTEETVEQAKNVLIAEVELYDKYISGEVYGVVIEKKVYDENSDDEDNYTLEEVSSCWGFYGQNKLSGILEEVENYSKELAEELS